MSRKDKTMPWIGPTAKRKTSPWFKPSNMSIPSRMRAIKSGYTEYNKKESAHGKQS